jgi:PAS domain S-box-containing protein
MFMTILGLSSSLFLGLSVAAHTTQELEKAAELIPFQTGSFLVTLASLIAVIHFLGDKKRRNLFLAFLLFTGALLIANFSFPYGIIYESVDGFRNISVLGWDGYNLLLGTTHSFYFPLALVLYGFFVLFVSLNTYDRFKAGNRFRAFTFGSILLIYVISNVYDTVVDQGIIEGALFTEYMMLPIILALSADVYLELQEGRFFTKRYKEVQKNFLTLIENVELFVVGIDLGGHITYVNKFFEQKLSVKSKELIGNKFFERFINAADHQEYKEVMQSLKQDREIKKVDFQLRKEGIDSYQVSWSIVPIKSDSGEITEILGVGTDITEQIQANSKLTEANSKLQKLARQLEDENSYLKMNLKEINLQGSNMIGSSITMKYVFHSIDEVAKTESTVLIEGETGVGKELVALLIHDKSNRFDKPFIKVNCGALPKDLIESELFGHVKGAFTGALSSRKGRFELADGGTIFLDEIGELPLELQAKLLRVLENSEFNPVGSERLKRVDVRVVAATNRNLKKFASQGGFRSDLYYRLSVFPITVPPLRNRIDDIPLLVEHFLISYCKKLNIDTLPVNVSTIKKLQSYSWPGNVRELKNVIERSVISSMNRGRLFVDKVSLKEDHLQKDRERKTLIEVEREYIVSILNETGWKISGKGSASSILDINEATLRSKMKRLGISRSGIKSI